MTLHDDAVGYVACFVAVIFFGSNFVPVKRVATADGMFFSLIMTSAVLLEGCVVQLWRGSPKFEPFAMLGGVIWYVETSREPGAPPPGLLPHAEPPGAPFPPPSTDTGHGRPLGARTRGARRFFFERNPAVTKFSKPSDFRLARKRFATTERALPTHRATGNLTVVPIVKSIGLGLGLLIWGLVGMLVGWASGHFGVLGVAPDPPLAAPWLNYLGVVFAAASLGVYANITSEVSGAEDRERGVPGATGHSERDIDYVGNSPRSPSMVLGGESPRANARPGFSPFSSTRPAENGVSGSGSPGFRSGSSPSSPRVGSSGALSPLGNGERAPLLFAGGESPHAASSPRSGGSSSKSQSPNASEDGGTLRWIRKAQEQTGGKFVFGFTLACVAGVFYGTNFNPPQRLIDEATRGDASHSTRALDYVFSHFCGIFFATLTYFIVYCGVKQSRGRKPQLPPCVLPAFGSGLMWGIAQICWFVANERLSFSVSFPIITSVPGLVGALWGVLVFGEIKGRDNITLLVASGVMRLVAVGLIAASKEGVPSRL